MTITLDIATSIKKAERFLNSEVMKAVVRASRHSIKRTVPTMKKIAVDGIKKERKIPTGVIVNNILEIKQFLKGSRLENIWAYLRVKEEKIPLLVFVKGARTPQKQKGIPVSARKTMKVEIKPGNKVSRKDVFIAKAKRGKSRFQVFRRKTKNTPQMVMQSIPRINWLFIRSAFADPIIKKIRDKFQREFDHNLKAYLDGTINRSKADRKRSRP